MGLREKILEHIVQNCISPNIKLKDYEPVDVEEARSVLVDYTSKFKDHSIRKEWLKKIDVDKIR